MMIDRALTDTYNSILFRRAALYSLLFGDYTTWSPGLMMTLYGITLE
jgi:hypothetical protein